MQNHPGIFIVLEGSDGSGKTTQFNLLKERLEAVGYDVEVFKFPQYDKDSSHFVRQYLNGSYGPATDINPYTASLFYALDRFEGAPRIRQALESGKIVLSDRYAGANMAHQGSKFTNAAEQRGFFVWADSMEFQLLGIPRPNLNIYLRVPAETSFELISKRAAREYTTKVHDEHEADINHLKKTVETYDLLCQLFPKDFYAVDCTQGGRLLSIPAINDRIWQYLQPFLGTIPKHQPHSKTVSLSAPAVLETPANQVANINSFDVDAKSQPLKIKLKHLSLLAVRSIATTTGIESQVKPSKKRAFYEPKFRNQKLLGDYRRVVKETTARHQLMLKVLQKSGTTDLKIADILLAATPLADFCDIDISCESSTLQKLITDTSSSRLTELNSISQTLYSSARQKHPDLFKSQQDSKLSLAPRGTFLDIADRLPQTLDNADNPLQLISAMPRNEFELINEGLYANASIARAGILAATDNLNYEEKSKLLKRLHQSFDAQITTTQTVSYDWEILGSGVMLNYLLEHRLLDGVIIQPATPRYGYEVPDLVSDTGIEELFTRCFDDSLGLFSQLQSAGHDEEAQYAVLLGHRLRWQATMSLSKILRLKALSSEPDCNPEIKSLFSAMQLAISQMHPLTGDWLAAQELLKSPETSSAPKTSRPKKRQRKQPKKPTKN
ncbi:thymidylate kinase [Candidatus Saccharibacteria bacterium]|nr:thymidylate kinase [Candidatus Saccharibacteria bacterium]